MPPGLPVTEGRETIYAQVSGNLEQFSWSEFEIHVAEVQVAGDWAYARGTYTANGTLIASSDPIFVDDKFMSIFQRQSDGSWKLHRDIFNSNE